MRLMLAVLPTCSKEPGITLAVDLTEMESFGCYMLLLHNKSMHMDRKGCLSIK